ncbi:MAG TPA: A/G-specific adenine glycosylase [Terriglobales bacterium]
MTLHHFRRHLLAWFDENKRDLPWRDSRDPYRVWLSEIMLQQTRVAAVIDYYGRFLRRFPTLHHLARARESSVLAAWSGLGYYRRARMLHAAAKKMVAENDETLPTSARELQQFPGIGRYTATAIASIAFGEPVAVVDGNVERVLQRVTGKKLAPEAVWKSAETMLDPSRPGDFNQAMMELGALVCLPRRPKCSSCPLYDFCATRGEHPRSRPAARQQKRTICYSLNLKGRRVQLLQRPSDASLMSAMWELPAISHANGDTPFLKLRHSITNTDYTVKVLKEARVDANARWVDRRQIPRLPLTGLARKILRAAKII